ncbi:MAG: efflux RND transporter permease subunit [Acidobacteria bacterium]|nr:efflux RND transporter permease subunit [Acidobacteriota bacterium]
MPGFAIRNPYFIVVVCLILAVVGITSLVRMPVDLFPAINIPVVVVATFYAGMPPEQIEADITSRYERFFTLASGIDHIESRSLPGVSLIKVYFQPGADAENSVSVISNLAVANLRRLPAGTLPPIVLKSDASSLPVCLVTLKGEGLDETRLRDLAQYTVRNQIANVPGSSVPQPFGGKLRQIMVYVDPQKLEAHQLSPMDVVRAVNDSNTIMPSGSVEIGKFNFSLYTNSQLDTIEEINRLPLKTVGQASVTVSSVGVAKDAAQIQNNVVRVDGQRSVYIMVLKQGGDSNTISVVDGIRAALDKLFDVPKQLVANVVFDQSQAVKAAIETLVTEGAIGLVLTSLMIWIFLGSPRATFATFMSIPLSALATFLALAAGGSSLNTMVLSGLALAFSRLIDNSVVVLENIFRHLELGESPEVAAKKGGDEVVLPVLAATLTTAVVFFPVVFLYGVSRFLFTALALAVVLSLAASYLVATTVVPLYCSRLLRSSHGRATRSFGGRFHEEFNRYFGRFLDGYTSLLQVALRKPLPVVAALTILFAASLTLYPRLGVAFYPRTDAGMFTVNLKSPSGTRLSVSEQEIQRVETLARQIVPPEELDMIVSNIGSNPGFSAVYTPNSGPHTAVVQVSLKKGHRTGTYEYMERVRNRIRSEMPQMTAYFQSGGMVDAVINLGLPAPIDVQVSGSNLQRSYETAARLASRIRGIPGVQDAYIPQDLDYPGLNVDVDRVRTSQLGLNSKEVVSNVITALASNAMIAPTYWVDPKSGNDYMLAVQYAESEVKSLADLKSIPLRSSGNPNPARLDAVTRISRIEVPTEVDHYQLQRVIDVYVALSGEDLGRAANQIDRIIAEEKIPEGVRVDLRGMVQGMRSSFRSFGLGLILAVLLLYLVLVAQFQSFADPVLILLAVPMGLLGVLVTLPATATTLNVQSLMGVVMMVGIVVSNSILIVEFTRRLRNDGMEIEEAVLTAARVRLRPVLMTSLATIIGLLPMAVKLGSGSEAFAPLARAIIGGLCASVILTVWLVPAAYILLHRRREVAG